MKKYKVSITYLIIGIVSYLAYLILPKNTYLSFMILIIGCISSFVLTPISLIFELIRYPDRSKKMGEPNTSSQKESNNKVIFIALILILGIIAFVFNQNDKPKNQHQPDHKFQAERDRAQRSVGSVEDMIKSGFIKKITPEHREVYVDLLTWAMMNIDQKEITSKAIAYYCGHKNGSDRYSVDVYDYQGGKKLAKYNVFGFKVY